MNDTDDSDLTKTIPLRNKHGKIVEYAIVDLNDLTQPEQHRWSKPCRYVSGYVNGKTQLLHRFIMQVTSKSQIVDHIDGNTLNNRRVNLRIGTIAQNTQNKRKKENVTSKYIGVSLMKKTKKWSVKCGNKSIGIYSQEIHAAHHYNLEAVNKYGEGAKLNEIETPTDFIPWVKKKTANLTGTCKTGNRYRSFIVIDKKKIYLGTFDTAEEAALVYNEALNEKKEQIINNKKSAPILRDSENNPLIPIVNTDPIQYVKVDENRYEECVLDNWMLNHDGNAVNIKSKVLMHRFIMQTEDSSIRVMHINHNKLDNRKVNLREVSDAVSNHNRKKKPNVSSVYVGVSYCSTKRKYRAVVNFNNKPSHGGYYEDELVAAYARDCLATELYGENASLNNVPQPEGWVYNKKRRCVRTDEDDMKE